MNAFKRVSFWRKMFRCAVMIMILLQTACTTQFPMVDWEPNDWNASNPSQLAAKGSDARMGARIVLLLHNEQEITGRLLSVRDNALVISTNEEQDSYIDAQTEGILVVENQHIQRVIIKGESGVQKGITSGLVIGARMGSATSNDPPDPGSLQLSPEAKAAIGGIVLGGAGMIVGGIIGAVASKEDIVSYPRMNHDFSALKPLARFPGKEPEYLSAIK